MNLPPKLPFYITSDSHFYHKNIIAFCDRPYDHELIMIKNWQRIVKWNDTIVHLGDLFFGGENGYFDFQTKIAPRLTGDKYIILGNHDRRKWDYEALGFKVIKPFSLYYRGYEISFDHYPKFIDTDKKRLHIHGHIHQHDYSHNEPTREGNLNVSVEMTEYKPRRATRLINMLIRKRNQSEPYRNSRHYRRHRVLGQRLRRRH